MFYRTKRYNVFAIHIYLIFNIINIRPIFLERVEAADIKEIAETVEIKETAVDVSQNINIGQHNYTEFVKLRTFVDKTLFIKDFFHTFRNAQECVYFYGPKGLGKSANLVMLRDFVKLHHRNTTRVLPPDSENFNFFSDKARNLAISNYDDIIKTHCSQYVTLHLDLSNVIGGSHRFILIGLFNAILECFSEYVSVFQSVKKHFENFNPNNTGMHTMDLKIIEIMFSQEVWQDIFQGRTSDTTLTNIIVRSLCAMSKILNFHFERPIFLFIDELDAPLINAVKQEAVKLQPVYSLITMMLSKVTKSNKQEVKHVDFVYITGINPVLIGESLLNNVQMFGFTRKKNSFRKYFGLLEEELRLKTLSKNLNKGDEIQPILEENFKGYVFEDEPKIQIFNPFQVVMYLICEDIANVTNTWLSTTGLMKDFRKLLKNYDFRRGLMQLLSHKGSTIEIDISEFSTINQLQELKFISNQPKPKMSNSHITTYYQYLFNNGFLTFTKWKGHYKIPNEAIRKSLQTELSDHYYTNNEIESAAKIIHGMVENFSSVADVPTHRLNQLALHLENGYISFFNKTVNEKTIVADHDHPSFELELKVVLFSALVKIIGNDKVAGELDADAHKWHSKDPKPEDIIGRADLMVLNRENSRVLIIEVKYFNNTNRVDDNVALQQVEKYFSLKKGQLSFNYLVMYINKDYKTTIETSITSPSSKDL